MTIEFISSAVARSDVPFYDTADTENVIVEQLTYRFISSTARLVEREVRPSSPVDAWRARSSSVAAGH